jgi:DNA polymerase elongation subunit (family B)
MFGLKELSNEAVKRIEDNVNEYFKKFNPNFTLKYNYYESEKDMLSALFNRYIPTMPIITGWNVIKYDWVYLVNRCRRLWPEDDNNYTNKKNRIESNSSPTGTMIDEFDSTNGRATEVSLPAHRLIVDYLDLFAKYDQKIKIKETNKLDFIGEQILGLKKIQYDGGLQELYENDFEKYMYYNIVDVILVKYIHEQCKYLDIMFAISSMAKIKANDVFSAVRTTEGVLRDSFKKELNILFVKNSDGKAITPLFKKEFEQQIYKKQMDKILEASNVSSIKDLKNVDITALKEKMLNDISIENDIDNDSEDEIIKGGWVKHPVTGMVQWVVVFDFASLYPTTMRQFNISPESYKGNVSSLDSTKCIYENYNLVVDYDSRTGKPKSKRKEVYSETIKDIEEDDIVLLNGTVFKNENSTSKKIIGRIFKDRKMYKKLMFEAKFERIQLEKELEKMI